MTAQTDDLSHLLVAAGAYDVGFAIFHMLFWRLFQWPASIHASGTVNAAITQTLNLMLTYCFLFYGGWLIWAGRTDRVRIRCR